MLTSSRSDRSSSSEPFSKALSPFTASLIASHIVFNFPAQHSTAFFISQLKEQICEINDNFKDTKQLISKQLLNVKKEKWVSYFKSYVMLNQFYRKSSLSNYSVPFTRISLVIPCLILSLYELPCELTAIHKRQLHDEAMVFNLPQRALPIASSSLSIATINTRKRKHRNTGYISFCTYINNCCGTANQLIIQYYN